mmetsp:Transcript_65745/g.196457  ORF Transcript_65745/g.196457 Transcript_65745/m.196457 type:complete len:135 (-) Transcript_65745:25-429(-)
MDDMRSGFQRSEVVSQRRGSFDLSPPFERELRGSSDFQRIERRSSTERQRQFDTERRSDMAPPQADNIRRIAEQHLSNGYDDIASEILEFGGSLVTEEESRANGAAANDGSPRRSSRRISICRGQLSSLEARVT